jgi:hypothetical protein
MLAARFLILFNFATFLSAKCMICSTYVCWGDYLFGLVQGDRYVFEKIAQNVGSPTHCCPN